MQGPSTTCAGALLSVVVRRASDSARSWLEQGLSAAEPVLERGAFFTCYAGIGRRFAAPALELSAIERDELARAGVLVPEAWSLADLARGALLCRALDALDAQAQVALATEVFRKGDNRERIALLRALPLLPAPERFAPLAAEAARTHVLEVFTALACENPYPARYLAEPSFNQLVMKTLFLDLDLERVADWRTRNNPALQAIAKDFEAERLAAGRKVPEGVAAITASS